MIENTFGDVSARNDPETRHADTGNSRGIRSRPVRLQLRRAFALPVYAVGLLLDYLSEVLGRLGAWIAGDDWPR